MDGLEQEVDNSDVSMSRHRRPDVPAAAGTTAAGALMKASANKDMLMTSKAGSGGCRYCNGCECVEAPDDYAASHPPTTRWARGLVLLLPASGCLFLYPLIFLFYNFFVLDLSFLYLAPRLCPYRVADMA
jgi:hypothetical protein